MTGVHPRVTELQAGTYAVMDADYARLAPAFRPALTVIATVVSRQGRDGGPRLRDQGRRRRRGTVPCRRSARSARCTRSTRCSTSSEGGPPAVGDVIELVVGYSGGTINLHDVYFVASGEEIVDVWPISARGPGWTERRGGGASGR